MIVKILDYHDFLLLLRKDSLDEDDWCIVNDTDNMVLKLIMIFQLFEIH